MLKGNEPPSLMTPGDDVWMGGVGTGEAERECPGEGFRLTDRLTGLLLGRLLEGDLEKWENKE